MCFVPSSSPHDPQLTSHRGFSNSLDPSHLTSLIPILETGLSDQNPLVTGSSLAALESICPDRLDLIHPHYRRYCKSLVDADEWTQVILLRVLELYARQEFPKPEKGKVSRV